MNLVWWSLGHAIGQGYHEFLAHPLLVYKANFIKWFFAPVVIIAYIFRTIYPVFEEVFTL